MRTLRYIGPTEFKDPPTGRWANGAEPREVEDAEAERLLASFPTWFAEVGPTPKSGPSAAAPRTKPSRGREK
jgi:hypothetical protein